MYRVNAVLSLFLIAVTGQLNDRCRPTAEISNGSCKLIHDCRVAIMAIRKKYRHPYKRCGFFDEEEIVCCPNESTGQFEGTSQDKFGDPQQTDLRRADRECQKLVDTSIPPLGLHIINGETASLGEFPHMVALGFPDDNNGYVFNCGGSLISEDYVITAAHCVENLSGIQPKIARLGVIDISNSAFDPNTDIMIEKIIIHPEYARKTKYNDITLLKLQKRVEMSANLSPICLYSKMDNPNVPLTITGWGKSSNMRDTTSNILLKANVSVVASSRCTESYTDFRRLPAGIARTQICAGDEDGRYDTCQGDSGGPLQALTSSDSLYRLIGITSFGRGCANTVPGVYTRVAPYLDWIEPIVWP